ncbi:MAG: AI-2E family transporter [Bifidobacteriaceae bacterium]|jgi:predicted PurR-regulated permease PerM|nr:AI-2E family transporter [Bifidobacteriaceae bacterium]
MKKFSLSNLKPEDANERRLPKGFVLALVYTAIVAAASIWIWQHFSKAMPVMIDLLLALFFALAMEPLIAWLIKKGWNRKLATFVTLTVILVAIGGVMGLFGSLFVQQSIELGTAIPSIYETIHNFLNTKFNLDMPEMKDAAKQLSSFITGDTALKTLSVALSIGTFIINSVAILLVVYYMVAYGPQMRHFILQWFRPERQPAIRNLWIISEEKIAGFLYSRVILAILCSIFTAIYLLIFDIPYWLPLALFTGIISQFIPTVGTYIGGALPVIVALGSNGLVLGVGTLVFIIIYQQIENLIFSPKVSQHTLDLNPAVSYISVLLFGYMFGALGAFLALPVCAIISVLWGQLVQKYPVEEHELVNDDIHVQIKKAERIQRKTTKKSTKTTPKSDSKTNTKPNSKSPAKKS